MTQEEAEKIAAIFETADGGCPFCAENLCEKANDAILGFRFVVVHGKRVGMGAAPWKVEATPT